MSKKQKLILNKGERLVGEVSFGLLGILALAMMSPMVMTETEALNEAAWTEMSTSLAVGLDETAEVDITPTAEGATGVATANLRVRTENASEHRIYVNTQDVTGTMTNVNAKTEEGIVALEGERSLGDLAVNTWGVAVTKGMAGTETLYREVPERAEVLLVNDGAEETMDEDYSVNFGVKIDTSLPAGQYANDVMVSVIASPNEVSGLLGIKYMQDMTPTVCTETRGADGAETVKVGQETTKQLIDTRDGTAYWVAKMADQNCWMMQNLALDLEPGKILTSSDTDLNAKTSWNPPLATETVVPKAEGNPSMTTARSWDLGEYVMKRPTYTTTCTWAGEGDKWNSVLPGQTLDRCSNVVQNVKGWTDDFVAQVVGDDYTTVDEAKRIYDAHFLVGNYYQWLAATAGSGNGLVSTGAEEDALKLKDAPDSICPKGWTLPAAGRNTVTGVPYDRENSYYRLLLAYGYPEAGGYNLSSKNGYTPMINGNGLDAAVAPLYFVKGGGVEVSLGALRAVGYSGYSRSRTAYPEAGIAFATGWNSVVWVSDGLVDSGGYNVRCVAR